MAGFLALLLPPAPAASGEATTLAGDVPWESITLPERIAAGSRRKSPPAASTAASKVALVEPKRRESSALF